MARTHTLNMAALAMLASLAFAGTARAQTGNFELELNSAADVDQACRLTFVATNGTGVALTDTSYEVAAFDGKSVVSSILVLEFGALPLNKTRVVQFDLPATKCTDLSRLLVNGQDVCRAADGDKDVCMKSLTARSSIPAISFGL